MSISLSNDGFPIHALHRDWRGWLPWQLPYRTVGDDGALSCRHR